MPLGDSLGGYTPALAGKSGASEAVPLPTTDSCNSWTQS
jgi:hypothetical protein